MCSYSVAVLRLSVAIVVVGAAVGLAGCRGDGHPPAQVVRVEGRVLGARGGAIADATVVVGDAPPIRTDASGSFAVDDVTTPYRVVVAIDDDGGELDDVSSTSIVVFEGLVSEQPRLELPFRADASERRACVSVADCTGIESLIFAGSTVRACLGTPVCEDVEDRANVDVIARMDDGSLQHATAPLGPVGSLEPIPLAFSPVPMRELTIETDGVRTIEVSIESALERTVVLSGLHRELVGPIVTVSVPASASLRTVVEVESSGGRVLSHVGGIDASTDRVVVDVPDPLSSELRRGESAIVAYEQPVFGFDADMTGSVHVAFFEANDFSAPTVDSLVVVSDREYVALPDVWSVLGLPGESRPSREPTWLYGGEVIRGVTLDQLVAEGPRDAAVSSSSMSVPADRFDFFFGGYVHFVMDP